MLTQHFLHDAQAWGASELQRHFEEVAQVTTTYNYSFKNSRRTSITSAGWNAYQLLPFLRLNPRIQLEIWTVLLPVPADKGFSCDFRNPLVKSGSKNVENQLLHSVWVSRDGSRCWRKLHISSVRRVTTVTTQVHPPKTVQETANFSSVQKLSNVQTNLQLSPATLQLLMASQINN